MNLRIVLISIILSGILSPGRAQNVLDLFKLLPDTSVFRLTTDQRRSVVRDHLTGKDPWQVVAASDHKLAIGQADIRNGFLTLVGHYEGLFHMCYWNVSDGSKLVAVYMESCGPVCSEDRLDFFSYRDGILTPRRKTDIIPVDYNFFLKGRSRTGASPDVRSRHHRHDVVPPAPERQKHRSVIRQRGSA